MKYPAPPASLPDKSHTRRAALVGAIALLTTLPTAMRAQAVSDPGSTDAPTAATKSHASSDDILKLDAVVVTAATRPGTTKMDSSISVSTLESTDLRNSVPRYTSEILRDIPAIRVESSSGEGNTNIAVRGLPISTGGAKYVQLQEDGLPILQFGDIAFGTADEFLRADATLATVESVRGGSASTFASNAPGGVINFISKTGEYEGGTLTYTRGLDFRSDRVDLGYGGPINDTTRFFVGGFFRTGEGAKTAGYNANNGGQLKANLTRTFANGYVRIYLKLLDDRTLSFMPVPMQITGSDSNPTFSSLPSFNALRGAINSPYLSTILASGVAGATHAYDLRDGIHAVSTAIGAEASFDIAGGWHLTDRFRVSKNSGDFIDPYPAATDSAQVIADGLAGPGATLRYANGPSAGQAINPATLNGNGLLMRVHLFNTQLNDLGNTFNDLKLNRLFKVGSAEVEVTGGLFSSTQEINMDWVWNAYLMEVKGRDAALVDVFNAQGAKLTDNGLIAYGTNYPGGWGNLQRAYRTSYTDDAPYAALSAKIRQLTLDASVRSDNGRARGSYADTKVVSRDVNGDGVISYPEQTAAIIDISNPSPVNYNWSFTSYSFGANYTFTRDLSAFARYSRGGSAGADRELWANGLVTPSGSFVSGGSPVAETRQAELGVKTIERHLVPGQLEFYATLFQARASEVSNDPTLAAKGMPTVFAANYKATGVELESAYRYGNFDLRVGATYTHSRNVDTGKIPQRTPDWMYQITPTYSLLNRRLTFGGAVIGVTRSYAGNDNTLVQPGYTYLNAFVGYELSKGLNLSIGVNNLFDTIGITEVDSGRSGPGGNVINARSITGRTTTASIAYSF